jgi:hypothetical protein
METDDDELVLKETWSVRRSWTSFDVLGGLRVNRFFLGHFSRLQHGVVENLQSENENVTRNWLNGLSYCPGHGDEPKQSGNGTASPMHCVISSLDLDHVLEQGYGYEDGHFVELVSESENEI